MTSQTPTLSAPAVSKFGEFRRGWSVLAGSLIGVGVGGASLNYYTSGVFMKELQAAWGWSRTELSAGMLVFTLVLAVASPFVGGLIDRFGVRRPVGVSLIAVALGFTGFAFVLNSLAGFFALQVFTALACAASTPLAFTRAVNDWFRRARGLALGLTLTGTGVAAAFAPALVSIVIEAHGWRAGYLTLALIILAAAPLVVWLVRLAPATPRNQNVEPPSSRQVFVQARGSRVFWMLLVAFFLMSLGFSGLIVHFVPLLTDAGISKVEAASLAGLIGLAVIGGRLIVGFLVDHFFAPYVAALAITFAIAGCLALAALGVGAAPVAALALGFAAGAEVDLIGYLTSRYFRLEAFGRIYGWQYGAFGIGNGLSPLWIAAMYDSQGSYQLALYGVVALLALTVAIFLTLPRYGDLKS